MNTTHTRKKAVVSVMAAAAALLFVGTGLAQAAPIPANAPVAPHYTIAQWPGGLTVHVTDRSGVTSWCTYSADWYHSLPFFLPANGTYDLLITPSFPEGRTWNTSVTCEIDGHPHTTTSTFQY